MKLKELVRKKFEIDRFVKDGEEEKIREKASSLQPEMENFELSTKDRFGIPYMAIGSGYEMNAISSDENIYVPRDIEEKFKSLYTKYSNVNGSSDRKSGMMSGIILLIGLF
jgi:hypothetical protein